MAERLHPELADSRLRAMFANAAIDTRHLALPLDGSTTNNAVLMYDTREGTWLLREPEAAAALAAPIAAAG